MITKEHLKEEIEQLDEHYLELARKVGLTVTNHP